MKPIFPVCVIAACGGFSTIGAISLKYRVRFSRLSKSPSATWLKNVARKSYTIASFFWIEAKPLTPNLLHFK
jgi:hypothetical protein